MGLFDLIKQNNLVSFENELPNKDLLYISYDKNIPSVNRGLCITINLDSNGNVIIDDKSNQIPDPSTIYIYLPITEDYNVPGLPYWPHYIELTSGQRYNYLCWLKNVEQPIDMGYVFLYYYGLERQLLIGNFEKAFNEIIKLRNVHFNKSFQKYSENALVHAAIMRNKVDYLIDLHEKTEISGYSNAMFLLAYNAELDLGEEQLILIFHKAFTTSRKAVKENKPLFVECLINTLNRRYGKPSFSFNNYNISKVKTITEARFANYSFPKEIQYVEITDFYQCKQLMQDLQSLFEETYSLYKSKKSELKSNKTPEELEIARKKKNESRYKKLLKEKLLTQEEYEVLLNYNNKIIMSNQLIN
ncbi:MAG: TerB N-terminal domain-containing protein [Ignavibacteriales bacterium]|nr:TerB N-terminal domain-containing protein [Ignavibacteriales bacterium]